MLSDNQLIDSLGGCNAVASILGISPPSVSGWNGRIPDNRRVRLAVVAEDRGICTRKELYPNDYQNIWIELRPEPVHT